jgi:hypothetical protein
VVHHVHRPVAGDGRGDGPVAAHVLQHRDRRPELPVDRRVLRLLREPPEEDHRGQHAEQDAHGDQERRQPGQQPDKHEDHDDRGRRAEGDRQRPLVLLVDQLRDHPDLLQPPGVLELISAVLVNHRLSLSSTRANTSEHTVSSPRGCNQRNVKIRTDDPERCAAPRLAEALGG